MRQVLAAGDRSVAIGGVSGSILITGDHNIIEGIRCLPTDYATRIQNFIVEYTGRRRTPSPSAGVSRRCERLTR